MFHRYLNLKTAVTVLVFVLVFSVNSSADPMYYNYVGTNSNGYPFAIVGGKAVNWLLLSGELNQPTSIPAGNMITDLYFLTSTSGSTTFADLTIKMAQDDITTLTSGEFYSGSWETVYYSPSVSLTAAENSWLCITLDSSFSYDPAKSLILSVEQSGFTGHSLFILQNELSNIRRVWSEGGYPFIAADGGDGYLVSFGVDVEPVPLPGAVILGGLGLSFAGWRLRRMKK